MLGTLGFDPPEGQRNGKYRDRPAGPAAHDTRRGSGSDDERKRGRALLRRFCVSGTPEGRREIIRLLLFLRTNTPFFDLRRG